MDTFFKGTASATVYATVWEDVNEVELWTKAPGILTKEWQAVLNPFMIIPAGA